MIVRGHSFLLNLASNLPYKNHGFSSNECFPFIPKMPSSKYLLLRKVSKEENEIILTSIKLIENKFVKCNQ